MNDIGRVQAWALRMAEQIAGSETLSEEAVMLSLALLADLFDELIAAAHDAYAEMAGPLVVAAAEVATRTAAGDE